MEKGLTIEQCVDKAEGYISKQGICLLLFDVKGSTNFSDKTYLINCLQAMMQDLNSQFGDYFPENTLANSITSEKGFNFLLGDASWTGINSSKAIPEIVTYQKQNYPNIPLYWGVAEDGFDKEGVKIAK
jgi:hypothetical protein